MPGRDGTGPMGYGAMTGRGMGVCAGATGFRYGTGFGMGYGCRRGFGRGFGRGYGWNASPNLDAPRTDKEFLEEQKEFLKSRLDSIDKQLDNM
jgi:hypothetical protein